jgi:hypothetical protein
VRTLLALTSFETFDTLAAADQDLLGVVPEIVALAEAVLETTAHPSEMRSRRNSIGDAGPDADPAMT